VGTIDRLAGMTPVAPDDDPQETAEWRAALQAYTEQLLTTSMGAEKLLRHREHPDRGVRRWAVTTALDQRLLSPGQAFDLSCTDADQLIRARCAEWVAAGSPDMAARLLTVRFVEARLAALQHLPDHDLADDQLRTALLDRSPRVRALAQWRSRRGGVDTAEIYRARLLGSQPRETAAALAGLASVGTAEDGPRVASLPPQRSTSRARVGRVRARSAGNPRGRRTPGGTAACRPEPSSKPGSTVSVQVVGGS